MSPHNCRCPTRPVKLPVPLLLEDEANVDAHQRTEHTELLCHLHCHHYIATRSGSPTTSVTSLPLEIVAEDDQHKIQLKIRKYPMRGDGLSDIIGLFQTVCAFAEIPALFLNHIHTVFQSLLHALGVSPEAPFPTSPSPEAPANGSFPDPSLRMVIAKEYTSPASLGRSSSALRISGATNRTRPPARITVCVLLVSWRIRLSPKSHRRASPTLLMTMFPYKHKSVIIFTAEYDSYVVKVPVNDWWSPQVQVLEARGSTMDLN